MSRQFSFHPVAEQELNEAAAYYEAEVVGSAVLFSEKLSTPSSTSSSILNLLAWSTVWFAESSFGVFHTPSCIRSFLKVFEYLRLPIRDAARFIGRSEVSRPQLFPEA
jgi:hypothetical protein